MKSILMGILMITLAYMLIATMIWTIWPLTIPNIFPELVNQCYIAENITWITSLGLVALIRLLIPSNSL